MFLGADIFVGEYSLPRFQRERKHTPGYADKNVSGLGAFAFT